MELVPALLSNRFQVPQIPNTISHYKTLAMQSTTALNYSLNSSDCSVKQKKKFQRSNPLKNSSNPNNLH